MSFELFFIMSDPHRMLSPARIAKEHTSVIFSCRSSTWTQWCFNNGSIPANAKSNTKTSLTIDFVDISNRGHYECRGTSEEGHTFYAKTVLLIKGELNHMCIVGKYSS